MPQKASLTGLMDGPSEQLEIPIHKPLEERKNSTVSAGEYPSRIDELDQENDPETPGVGLKTQEAKLDKSQNDPGMCSTGIKQVEWDNMIIGDKPT